MKFKTGYTIQDGITQGLLMNFMACRVKARNKLNGWRKRGPDPRGLRFGTLVHCLLEIYHKLLKDKPADVKQVRGSWRGWLMKRWRLMAEAHTRKCLKTASDVETTEAIELEKVKGLLLVDAYVDHWHRTERVVRFVDVEPTFDVKFHGYRLRGRKDGLFMKRSKLWLLETKTMSVIRESELHERLSYDFQLQYYLTALRIASGTNPGDSGALFNILHTPVKDIKKGESVQAYVDRIKQDIRDRPEFYFRRYEVVFPRKVLAAFEKDLFNIVSEFDRWLGDGLTTFKNQSACFSFYPCPFIASCASESMTGYERTDVVFPELLEVSYASSN